MRISSHITAICISCLLFSCGNRGAAETQKEEGNVNTVTEQGGENQTGGGNGQYMKATIDGKPWTATKIGPRYAKDSDYKLVSGETSDITINFQLHKPHSGMKRQFREDFVANFITDEGFFGGREGEVTVTAVHENWFEGTFYFTATNASSGKSFEITEGSFRVSTE